MNSDSDELIKNSKLNISCTGSNVWLGIKDYLIPEYILVQHGLIYVIVLLQH